MLSVGMVSEFYRHPCHFFLSLVFWGGGNLSCVLVFWGFQLIFLRTGKQKLIRVE